MSRAASYVVTLMDEKSSSIEEFDLVGFTSVFDLKDAIIDIISNGTPSTPCNKIKQLSIRLKDKCQ